MFSIFYFLFFIFFSLLLFKKHFVFKNNLYDIFISISYILFVNSPVVKSFIDTRKILTLITYFFLVIFVFVFDYKYKRSIVISSSGIYDINDFQLIKEDKKSFFNKYRFSICIFVFNFIFLCLTLNYYLNIFL